MQNIGEIIQEAIDLMERGLYDKAFVKASVATRETIKKSLKKDELILFDYKQFVDEQWDLIAFMCFPNAKSPYLDVQFLIKEISMNPRRSYTIKEVVVYLLTYANKIEKIPSDITFFTGNNFKKSENNLLVPSTLVGGLLALLVVQPINEHEQIPDKYWVNISDFKMFVSELWGRIDIAERVRKFYLTR